MKKTWLVIEREIKQNCIVEVTKSDNILAVVNRYPDILTMSAYTTKKEARERIEFLYNLNKRKL